MARFVSSMVVAHLLGLVFRLVSVMVVECSGSLLFSLQIS